MRIAIISSIYNSSEGGAVGIAVKQAQELRKRGYDVFVLAGTLKGDLGWQEEKGIKIYKVRVKNYRYFIRSYSCIFNWRLQKEFKKFLDEVKPDIVHSHNLFPYLPFSFLKIAKKKARKVFFTAHDVMTFSQFKLAHFVNKEWNLSNIEKVNYKVPLGKQIKQNKKAFNPFRNIVIRYYLKYVNKILAVGEELKEVLERNKIKNVEVVHNGVDVEVWQADKDEVQRLRKKFNLENKKVILFAGRISALKGSKKIAEAMKLVIEKIPEVVLLVLDSKERSSLDLLKENLILAGSVARSEMKNYYAVSKVVVVPSVCFDSFPTVNLEAMACHKPVIATLFGGSREVIENKKTGFIVNPVNVDDLANKIIYLLENSKIAETMGEKGYEIVKQRFNVDDWINKILSFY